MSTKKHLVLVAIYELMDQNRDEGVGSVQTLKKLHRVDGAYTFISKYSKRHHLFNELKDAADWKSSEVTVDNKVIQFDLTQDDIITSPELDAFGYMFTLGGDDAAALTRKAAVGLTDVISLEPYTGDSAFYANHDLVQRALSRGFEPKEVSPDPYSKEEHLSLYKGGMTINLNRLGVDEWVINRVEEKNDNLEIPLSRGTKTIRVEPLSEDQIPEYLKSVVEKYGVLIEEPKYFKDLRGRGYIVYGKIRGSNRYKVLFVVNEKELGKRVKDLLETYLDGFKFQVGGRDYSMVPVFCAVAVAKSPLQVFFPNIGVKPLGNSRFEVLGLVAPVANAKVEKVYLGWNTGRIEIDLNTLESKVGTKLVRKGNNEIVNLCEDLNKEEIIEGILKEIDLGSSESE